MGWLYAQTWLWYLLSFAVGVLLAWLLFVRRGDRSADRSPAGDATAAGPVGAAAPAPGRSSDDAPGAVEPVTEQLPAVDPALSTLDTASGRSGVGGAGLAAGALGAVGGRGADDGAGSAEVTGEIPRTDPEATTRIPVVRPAPSAAPGSGEETARIPVVGPETATDPGLHPGSAAAAADRTDPAVAPAAADGGGSAEPLSAERAATGGTDVPAGPAASVDGATAGPGSAERVEDAEPVQNPAPVDPAPVGAAAVGLAVAAARPADRGADRGPDHAVHHGVHHGGDRTAVDVAGEGAGDGVEPGRFPGSALPREDGAPPTPEHTVKGNGQSMLYHTAASPYYSRTRAEVWFVSTADAEAAGFTDIRRRRR